MVQKIISIFPKETAATIVQVGNLKKASTGKENKREKREQRQGKVAKRRKTFIEKWGEDETFGIKCG